MMREAERLLVRLSRAFFEPDEAGGLRRAIEQGLGEDTWARFYELAIVHRVVCLVARNLDAYDLYPAEYQPGTLGLYKNMMRMAYAANSQRNEELLEELGAILAALEKNGVLAVVRKGPALLSGVYHDVGARQMQDLDLMIDRKDRDDAQRTLESLGYRAAKVSESGRELRNVPRRVALFRKLYVPNLELFRQGESRFVRWFKIDFSMNQFLPGAPWSVPSDRLPERSRPVDLFGVPAHVLTWEEALIDLCTHAYKEATTLFFVNRAKDLCLYKFVDIAEIGRSGEVDWALFESAVRSYGIEKPVYHALHFTEALYPGSVPESVRSALRPQDVGYLDEVGADEGQPILWSRPFPDRMFAYDRMSEVPGSDAEL